MKRIILIVIACVIFFEGCERSNMTTDKNKLSELKSTPNKKLRELSQKKIFFGHQSVGNNIIDGIKDIIIEYPELRLNIQQTSDPASYENPVFGHARVGSNLDPYSKCNEFKKILEGDIGNKIDIAFIKFCYVDVNKNTDIIQLYNYYVKTFQELQKKFPNIKFIHMTIPLTTSQQTSGIKALVKRIFKKEFWGEEDNIKRNLFNIKLISKYSKDGQVFDLAKFESEFPDGRLNIFNKCGYKYYSLITSYTDDGGHLNKVGRNAIAQRLLLLLTELK